MTGGWPIRCINSPISRPHTSSAIIWRRKITSEGPRDALSAANAESETTQSGTAASSARRDTAQPTPPRLPASSAYIRSLDLVLTNLATMLSTRRRGRSSDDTPPKRRSNLLGRADRIYMRRVHFSFWRVYPGAGCLAFRVHACVRRRPHRLIRGLALARSRLRILRGPTRHFSEQTISPQITPEQVRSKIDHPIVDGDGHWVEYDPVFSDKMRKVGGDLAADGFSEGDGDDPRAALHVGRRAPPQAPRSAGLLGPPGRKHARPCDRDDAKAALRPPRRIGPRLCHRLSDRRAALSAHPGRCDPPRRDPSLQRRIGRLF